MPLTFDANLNLKRGRGRPSAADRTLEQRLRAEAQAELAELDPLITTTDKRFAIGTKRWRDGPPKLTGRSLKFIGLVASGMNEEEARQAVKLHRGGLTRLLATSPLFKDALAGAHAAAAALSP